MSEFILLASPILVVLIIAIYCIWTLKKRRKQKIQTRIKASGNEGEKKVQTTLKMLENSNKKYKIYHNIKLGPDLEHTNEYDTLVIGPNGVFHIETKNYGGERGGIIDIDSNNNWILHKKNGYSKIIVNPISQVESHEYRLKGFLYKKLGLKGVPTQGLIVLSCDRIDLRLNNRNEIPSIPILHRNELIDYIKNFNQGETVLSPKIINRICNQIELMNKKARV